MFTNLQDFLKREGDFSFWKNIIFMAMLAGLANAGLLAVINTAAKIVEDEGLNYRLFAIYAVIFLIFYISKRYSLIHASQEVERIIKNVRERISEKILKSELQAIEKIDTSAIFTRLTRDTAIMSQSSFQITNAAEGVIMIFFALIYILILSPISFFVILFATIIILSMFLSFSKIINKELTEMDRAEEGFIRSLTSILNGFKELKMNSKKREDINSTHKNTLTNLSNAKIKNSTDMVTYMMYGEVFLYILLASVVFIVPHLTTEESIIIIQVTATTLFIIGPFETIVNVAPMVSRTNVAINNIYDLEASLNEQSKTLITVEDNSLEKIEDFKQIQLKNASFYYTDKIKNKLFKVGPINLSINKGETIFIIGGNGSGKSTIIKMLLGLYPPKEGSIFVDEDRIDEYTQQSYRNLFSIILTDFHLFEKFYGLKGISRQAVNALLREMQLEEKTKFVNGGFTNIDLSTGQKKRLALILSILEDKQIYVFDEWAADQDPEFRKYFYTKILDKLKKDGKTIIAVTHDDAYFHVADRIFKMEYGQMLPYPKGN
ncbi:MAG: Peptide ABC transporter ATP-binding protein [uncultured Sulfurovum sp.]|uniref:Peptide ABC transporter ATP-binding protein n=1 Tax=uncultured Sulfurovum sp. TaxID=269237 RepID=A0A6S6RYQ4_9BACT|nr:MAG: Peptide ABC transporter ATP-binding protein [uncultured Sulfurovum sp.]